MYLEPAKKMAPKQRAKAKETVARSIISAAKKAAIKESRKQGIALVTPSNKMVLPNITIQTRVGAGSSAASAKTKTATNPLRRAVNRKDQVFNKTITTKTGGGGDRVAKRRRVKRSNVGGKKLQKIRSSSNRRKQRAIRLVFGS